MKKYLQSVEDLNDILCLHFNKKIVFTNGVFDILHPGHVQLLTFARSKGDILVLGINDDESVRRLKGPQRPILSLKERVTLLAGLAAVNYIIPFAEDTPLELIRQLCRIDVLVKGGDYSPEEVVGRVEVEAGGGSICLFPFQTEVSSTDIIRRIKENLDN